MNPKTSKVKMTYSCNQDWDEMHLLSVGRYCNSCNKEIFDFSGYTNSEINKIISTQNILCGRFHVEQVDDSLIKPIELSRKAKLIGFISTLFLTIHIKSAYSQDTTANRIEKIELINKSTNSDSNVLSEDSKSLKKTRKKPNANNTIVRPKRLSLYRTKKFPFIRIVRRRHVLGMITPAEYW